MGGVFCCRYRTQDSSAEAGAQAEFLDGAGHQMKEKKNRKRADHSGSSFDSFLEQQGIREEVEAVAIKRVPAWQVEQAMQKQL